NPRSLATETDTFTVNGRTFTRTFDAAARKLTTTTPEGRSVVQTLDDKGHLIQYAVAGLPAVRFTYDAQGNLATMSDGTRTDTYTRDAQERPTAFTDPLGNTVQFAFDAADRITQETLPDG